MLVLARCTENKVTCKTNLKSDSGNQVDLKILKEYANQLCGVLDTLMIPSFQKLLCTYIFQLHLRCVCSGTATWVPSHVIGECANILRLTRKPSTALCEYAVVHYLK